MLVVKKFDYKHDIKFLYSLRKNIQVRSFFFNNRIVDYSNHLFWIRKIAIKNLIFIVYYEQKKIGYIRYNNNHNSYNISIANLPDFRKKGLMKKAILESEKMVKKKIIFAEVIAYNKLSIKFFKSCGYKIFQTNNNKLIFKKSLTKN